MFTPYCETINQSINQLCTDLTQSSHGTDVDYKVIGASAL